jgi:CBS domain-containing protein/anti-sigma regulatory factor (Ser/Thr protein kinase)
MSDHDRLTRVQELVYELKVGDAMSREVVTVGAGSRMSELREVLRTHRISGVPVVAGDRVVGIISIEDFINWLVEGKGDCLVTERMTEDVKALYEDEPLVLAVGRFEKRGFGRFPVLDRKTGRLTGVITKGDIIERVLRKLEIDYHEEEIRRYRASHIFEDIVADEVALVLKSHVEGRNFERAGHVSSSLRRALNRLNVHPHTVRRASIASYEAEMNVVIYTDGGDVVVEIRPHRIEIDVIDGGPGIPDIEQAFEPGYSTAPDWVRELGFGAGMGLQNIKRCSDEVNLRSVVGKGTHLTIGIEMKGNGTPSRAVEGRRS